MKWLTEQVTLLLKDKWATCQLRNIFGGSGGRVALFAGGKVHVDILKLRY